MTARVIDKGRKNERLLIQPQYHPMAVEDEVAVIYSGVNGLLENVPLEKVAEFEKQYLQLLHARYTSALDEIRAGRLTDEVTAALNEAAAQVAGQF